jgi:D-serine deaminase-like pyridoxal phosphate-dependent protein
VRESATIKPLSRIEFVVRMDSEGVFMFGADLVGRPLSEVDTPALVIDADAMEANISDMAKFFETVPTGLRPHAKTHKSPIVAQKQIDAGAIGATCAKLGEAEALQQGGIKDILIANQIVGHRKIARLVRMARHCNVAVAVDNEANAKQISDAAVEAGSTVRILVEVNIGMNRCGVEPGRDAMELVKKVHNLPGTSFFGFQAYEGHLVMYGTHEERQVAVQEAMAPLIETRREVEAAGFEVPVISGGGTGTYDITSQIAGFDEVQAGSYVFMDAKYNSVDGPGTQFSPAIYLWSTIVSRPTDDRAILDIGLKTAAPEMGLPKILDVDGANVEKLSEEHAIASVTSSDARQLAVGDQIRVQPGHVCTTVNLHESYVVARNGVVEAVWKVAGRGRSQ